MTIRSAALQDLINDDWLGDAKKSASPSLSYDSTSAPESFENVLYWTTCIIDNKPVISSEESKAFGVRYTPDGIELSVPLSRQSDHVNTAYILTRYAARRQLPGNSLDAILGRSRPASQDTLARGESGKENQGGLVDVLKGANGERIEDENLEVGGNPGIEEVETGRDLANTKTDSLTSDLLASPFVMQGSKTHSQSQEANLNYMEIGPWDMQPELEPIEEAPEDTIPTTSDDQTGEVPTPPSYAGPSITPAPAHTSHETAAGPSSSTATPVDVADDAAPDPRNNAPVKRTTSTETKPSVAGVPYHLEGLERCQRCIKQELVCLWTPGTRCGSCKGKGRPCELAKPRCMVDSADLRLLQASLANIMRIAEEAGLEDMEQKAEECQRSRTLFEFRNHGMRVLQDSPEPELEE